MRLAKFLYKTNIHWGVVNDDNTINFLSRDPFEKILITKKNIPIRACKLLAPATASKIILVGLNYRDHARELKMAIPKEPLIFLKPSTSLIGPGEKIIYPPNVKRLDYEAELAFVIRKKAKDISSKDYRKYILGYTCLNDVTARDIQTKDTQWTRAKSFDTFCPAGPWLETEFNPNEAKINLYLNDDLRQNSSTENFIFSVAKVFSFISKIMTLLPGDIISTGTPPGVGFMKKGDKVTVSIDGIGDLTNYIR